MKSLSGTMNATTLETAYNANIHLLTQNILGINTAEIVQVISINYNNTINVKPLLFKISADNKSVDTSIIYNIPYIRHEGGINAIILKPQVNDIGLVVYCQRDISSLKKTGKASMPPTKRAYNSADGIYIASIASLVAQPKRFIEISDTGINITAPDTITINGKTIINGDVQINGKTTTTDDIISGDISMQKHLHTNVQPGTGVTGEPQ